MGFTLGQWEESDGIGECEEIIKLHGGDVYPDGTIDLEKVLEKNWTIQLDYAIEYLCDEWDYGLLKGYQWKEGKQ